VGAQREPQHQERQLRSFSGARPVGSTQGLSRPAGSPHARPSWPPRSRARLVPVAPPGGLTNPIDAVAVIDEFVAAAPAAAAVAAAGEPMAEAAGAPAAAPGAAPAPAPAPASAPAAEPASSAASVGVSAAAAALALLAAAVM
jgi:hypothetical protein